MTVLEQYLQTISAVSHTQPAVAFFDLDRTLIAGYSILAIAQETAQQGARRGQLRQSAKVIRDILKHKVDGSGGNYHRLVRRTSRALSGVTESTLQELGEQAYRKHENERGAAGKQRRKPVGDVDGGAALVHGCAERNEPCQ